MIQRGSGKQLDLVRCLVCQSQSPPLPACFVFVVDWRGPQPNDREILPPVHGLGYRVVGDIDNVIEEKLRGEAEQFWEEDERDTGAIGQ